MNKSDFYNILCTSTPEEINSFISLKGKKKTVNGITFISDEQKEVELASIKESLNNLNNN